MGATGSRLTLKVTPQVAFEPGEIAIIATRKPDPTDRLWTISLVLDGEDEQFPLISSAVSLEGENGDLLKRLHWDHIPAGNYWVLSCVAPGPACARTRLLVTAPPP
jgi:hypothetical protein